MNIAPDYLYWLISALFTDISLLKNKNTFSDLLIKLLELHLRFKSQY